MIKKTTLAILLAFLATAFVSAQEDQDFVNKTFESASVQLHTTLALTKGADSLLFPRASLPPYTQLVMTNMYDWTPGFFPGNLWYAYEGTRNETLKNEAIRWTEKLEPLKSFTRHHDLGFMMYCSYGNAFRLTGNEKYKNILVESAKSLITRFNPKVGSIKSWDTFKSWDGKSVYEYPVIIDNMMNLELLFFASNVTGNPEFRKVALQHADNVIKNQLRKDYSCYHVICYDGNGKPLAKETAQGYANNSTWSRGQAWGIYGFTMTYRETKNKKYLEVARKMADFYLKHPNLPKDKVPYWDFNALEKGYISGEKSFANDVKTNYRDASAAAITASALLELSTYIKDGSMYKNAALDILHSLASPAYLAATGTNSGFLLKHSVGSIPHHTEIDVPLVYADYYFLEALKRYQQLLKGNKTVASIAGTVTKLK